MKYIVFSFDDGRKDTYVNAAPILIKNGLTASIHVVTGFVDGTVTGDSDLLVRRGFMSVDNCLELLNEGFDISSHSNSHSNSFEDIELSFRKLKEWGFSSQIGFSSPRSNIDQNISSRLFEELKCKYIRSGTRLHDRSFFDLVLYSICYFLGSKKCFSLFNSKYIIKDINFLPAILPSVAVKSRFKAKMLIYLLNSVPENGLVILNFHSIVEKIENKWDFKLSEFDKLCKYISQNNNYTVLNLKQLMSK
ncbi:polysaccharide deacetylase family protein [bacterium]|nr:polysaccharide deacetylase family protein [bacterium]